MSKKFWRRLAGCIVIECCLTAAPRPEFRAGAAASEHARAVVIEDRKGYRAVFVDADFPITRDIADAAAAQLVKAGGIDRAAIVITGSGPSMPQAGDIVDAAARALLGVDRATLSFDGVLSVRNEAGCIATLYPLRFDACREGAAVHGPIRAAFRMVDVPHPLQTRDASPRAYPVQAVSIGKVVTVLALGGNLPAAQYAAPGRIVVTGANDSRAAPDPAVVDAAVAQILKRVR